MKIAIGQAYNGLHRKYKKHIAAAGAKTFLFDIDKARWMDRIKKEKPDAIFWHADSKEERYYIVTDRIYFIENFLNLPVFPDMNMYSTYGDKIKQNDIFKLHDIPTPKTFVTFKKDEALTFAKNTKYPFILKHPYGYGGWHVFKIDNLTQAKKFIEEIFSKKGHYVKYSTLKNIFYVQEFLKVEKDLRVIVIGGKTFCAYWRQGQSGDWRHNVGQGGGVHFEGVPKKALTMCEKITKKLNFHWMSYDLFIMPNGEIKLVEFSCNFGFKGGEAHGYDVRKAIGEYVVKYLKKKVK